MDHSHHFYFPHFEFSKNEDESIDIPLDFHPNMDFSHHFYFPPSELSENGVVLSLDEGPVVPIIESDPKCVSTENEAPICKYDCNGDSYVPETVDENDAAVENEGFTYESPPYLYGPDYFNRRMMRRRGRNVRPRDPSMGSILTRNDDLPDQFKEVVAPDTYDGYEGVNLKDLEDDADSHAGDDVWAWRNQGVDLFCISRK